MKIFNFIFLFISNILFFYHSSLLANIEIPDFYSEPGFSSNRSSSIGSVSDAVDPFSGQLSISHTDLFIPGNGGFDLSLIRSYSTHRAQLAFGGKSIVGHGWDLHMGRILFNGPLNSGVCNILKTNQFSTSNPVLELPDGSKKLFIKPKYIYSSSYGSVTEQREVDFITRDFWIADCHNTAVGGMTVTSPSGVVYRFDLPNRPTSSSSAYFVSQITDARGNSIFIEYDDQYITNGTASNVIKKITANDGRIVNFEYGQQSTSQTGHPSFPLLTAIKSDTKEVFYTYSETSQSIGVPPFVYLDAVSKTDGDSWIFSYYPYRVQTWTNAEEEKASAQSNLIKDIQSDLGSITRYDYDFIRTGISNGVNPAVTRKSINAGIELEVGDAQGTWTYVYELGPVDGENYDKTTVITPTKKEVYRHFGTFAADLSAENIDLNELRIENPGLSDREIDDLADAGKKIWKIGSLLEKTISEKAPSNKILQIETYDWKSQVISTAVDSRSNRDQLFSLETRQPLLNSKTVWRDMEFISGENTPKNGTLYITNYNSYDLLGNPGKMSLMRETGAEIRPIFSNAPYDYTAPIQKDQYMGYYTSVDSWLIGLPAYEDIYEDGNSQSLLVSSIFRNYFPNGLVKEESNNQVFTQFTYDDHGDLLTVTDANNHQTSYSGYTRGIPTREEYANGVVLTRSIDTEGRISSETDGRQNTKTYTYDRLDRLLSITPPLNTKVNIEWPRQTQRQLTRDGFMEEVKYNNQGYLVSRTLSGEEPIATYKRYDVIGRLIFESYPNSDQGVTYIYDALDRLVRKEEPGGKSQEFSYKAFDRVDVTDGKGQTVEYYYRAYSVDGEKELMAVVEPEDTSTVIARDLLGNVISLTQNGITRTYTYDSRYFLSEENNPETGLTEYAYDGVGNLLQKRINGEGITNYTYDDSNRLISVAHPALNYVTNLSQANAQPVRVESLSGCQSPCRLETQQQIDNILYDENSNVIKKSRLLDVDSITFSGLFPQQRNFQQYYDWDYVYNDNNLLTQETMTSSDGSYTFGYSYNSNDALQNLTYPSGLNIDYLPDNYNRPTQVGSFVSSINYHPSGFVAEMIYGNGLSKTTTLTSRLNIDSIDFSNLGVLSYTYDNTDNIQQIIDTVNSSGGKTLNYDAQNRLTSASGPWGSASYVYDEKNNIQNKNIGGIVTNYSYDNSNRLAEYTSGNNIISVTYDKYGNIITKGSNAYDYDHQGNMLGARTEGLRYIYDANNRRVKETQNSNSILTFYSQAGLLLYEIEQQAEAYSEYIYIGSELVAKRKVLPQSENVAPVVVNPIADQSIVEGEVFDLVIADSTFSDADGDSLDIAVGALPEWLSFDSTLKSFLGTPSSADIGTVSITVTADDGKDSVSDIFVLTINALPENVAPVVVNPIADQLVLESEVFNFIIADSTFSDADGDNLEISVGALPDWLSFDPTLNSFLGTPSSADIGAVSITVTADDGEASVSDTFTLTIDAAPENRPPTVTNPIVDQVAIVGQLFDFNITASTFTDLDDDNLQITIDSVPAWLIFDDIAKSLTGTPSASHVGVVSINVTASDGRGGSVSDTFTLTIQSDVNNEDWIHCVQEWGRCTLPAPALVRYGIDGQYFYQQINESTVYCGNSVFGNPNPSVRKNCDYLLSDTNDHDGDGVVDSLDAYPSDANESADSDGDGFGDNSDLFPNDAANAENANWVHCVQEWGRCALPAPAIVRYGINGQYFYQQINESTVYCGNSVFGNPNPSVRKNCDYLLSDTNDHDGDGVVDSLDAYPSDANESADSDGDGFGDNSDLFPNDAANAENANWVHCVQEWGRCTLPAPAIVRYGIDGQYFYQQINESTVYCGNSVFGNPNPSVRKNCDYLLSDTNDHDGDGVVDSLDVYPSDANESADSDGDGFGDNSDLFPNDAANAENANWVHCVQEWGRCTLPAPAIVRYGIDGQYFYQQINESTVYCGNSVFGNPNPSVRKNCDYLLSDTNDHDGDGVVDSLDAYPSDANESADSDGDGFGDNSDLFPNDAANAENANWVHCVQEWGRCTLPAPAIVRYGIDGQYFYQQINESTVYCGNSVFGNPNPSVRKNCDYLLSNINDHDNDGVVDGLDLFPADPNETIDTDTDGVGDNTDPFPNDATNEPDNTHWIFCANEWESCSVSAPALVRYGAQGQFFFKQVDNAIDCTNSVFTDPIGHVVKRCDYLVLSNIGNN